MSIKVALRKGRMAEVWMAWKDEVGLKRTHQIANWITYFY